jgi:hypothetical protein
VAGEYHVDINFLPIVADLPSISLFRMIRNPQDINRPAPGMVAYKLPDTAGSVREWRSYWVSLEPMVGFDPFNASADMNVDLTRWRLFRALLDSVQKQLQHYDYQVSRGNFIQEISFIITKHTEGNETLVVQPYFLRAKRQFGFLVDFHFVLAPNIAFSRRVQQLSLSLDRNFKRNLDYYIDRTAKLRQFMDVQWPIFSSIYFSDQKISILKEFASLPADRLSSKSYIFSGNHEAHSQFSGLKDHGPLTPISGIPNLLFVFREQDRQAARTLAVALRGSQRSNNYGYPGFQTLFRSEVQIDRDPVLLRDLSELSMNEALEMVQKRRIENPNTVPILVLPDAKDNGYLIQKALFVHSGIPTQVCTLRIIQDENTLKWAIGNLALQIFCKAGGQPWKVRQTPSEGCLIIGISQSHKRRRVNDQAQIEKYFAFSVMTDSSGLFQKIQVLGEGTAKSDYLSNLRSTLKDVLIENANLFGRVVIHTSFRLQKSEMQAIEQTVREAAGSKGTENCRFAVVKVNSKNRFFGINTSVNSLVPFEATRVRLGMGEYLVWFEGIFPDKTTVTKAFPGPTHLRFLHGNEGAEISDDILLQDLVNLSGANWRGFNAKSAPVSVFYCHLIADLVREFHELGLPLPAVQDIRPWFL